MDSWLATGRLKRKESAETDGDLSEIEKWDMSWKKLGTNVLDHPESYRIVCWLV